MIEASTKNKSCQEDSILDYSQLLDNTELHNYDEVNLGFSKSKNGT